MNAAQAFIAYLRCEARQAEERAKSLRATAAAIQSNAELNIANRKKKRKRSPTVGSTAEAKRAHTGYTLFVHENYESIKGRHLSSAQRGVINEKEVNSTLAKRWGQIDDIEKQSWQERADRLNRAQVSEKHPTSVDLEHPEGTDIFETVALCDPHLTEAETASQNNEESNARKVTRK